MSRTHSIQRPTVRPTSFAEITQLSRARANLTTAEQHEASVEHVIERRGGIMAVSTDLVMLLTRAHDYVLRAELDVQACERDLEFAELAGVDWAWY